MNKKQTPQGHDDMIIPIKQPPKHCVLPYPKLESQKRCFNDRKNGSTIARCMDPRTPSHRPTGIPSFDQPRVVAPKQRSVGPDRRSPLVRTLCPMEKKLCWGWLVWVLVKCLFFWSHSKQLGSFRKFQTEMDHSNLEVSGSFKQKWMTATWKLRKVSNWNGWQQLGSFRKFQTEMDQAVSTEN